MDDMGDVWTMPVSTETQEPYDYATNNPYNESLHAFEEVCETI